MRKLISIVTPCYNEELNVRNHLAAVRQAVQSFRGKYDFEHIYTDNASLDNTFGILSDMALENSDVKALRFSRNIGSTRAMMMGLSRAKGDATILIQADLQDPPELIPDFISEWENGYDIVYGLIRNRQKENFVLQALRKLYYRIIDNLSEVPIPRNAGDFRLTSRRALDAILNYREYEVYLRGVAAHVGFAQKAIPYDRRPRIAGESNAPFFYLVSFALNSLIATSVAPLRLITIMGSLVSVGGFCMSIYFIAFRLFFPERVPTGFTTMGALIAFFSGLQILAIGIIGEYIRKIYLEVQSRPRGFVRDEINFN